MGTVAVTRYQFGDFEIDTARFELRRAGAAVHMERQVFDVLAYLVAHRDRVVPKAELLDAVWSDRFVSESALASRIKVLRRSVGDDGTHQAVIRTVFGRGYQFVAERGRSPTPTRRRGPPACRRCSWSRRSTSARPRDGTRLAYSVVGDGPVLVKAANWMTHLDYDLEHPVWRHWTEDVGRDRSLLRYDERGCGLSDWDVDRFDFDSWVDDLETVVDSAGLDRFPLLGVSQGGAVAVAFAVRHPERVSRLVLYGAYARGRLARADDRAGGAAGARSTSSWRGSGWGGDDPSFRQVFTSQFLPDGTREEWDELNELQRRTTSPENAVRFLETFARIDVGDAARQVACPTLDHARP